MEIGLAILLFVCMTALLYVVLSLKISRQVDLQIKEFYKTRIHSDMQEFYREMEGYAALFENRIQRFRVLVERNELAVREFDTAAPPQPPVEPVAEPKASPARSAAPGRDKKHRKGKQLQGKISPPAKKQPAKPPIAVSLPLQVSVKKPARSAAPQRPIAVSERLPPTPPPSMTEDTGYEDSAIAEELIKDLFLQDEVALSKREMPLAKQVPQPSATAAQSPDSGPAESPGMVKFFSRLGKAIEPVLFGDKAAAAPKSEIVRTAPAAATKTTSDFSEVLRRAEQIKAEKAAERERAEVEAKAEFYAGGDVFRSSAIPPQRNLQNEIAEQNEAARIRPQVLATAPLREEPRRNALVVKELDRHTVSFLIDSLVKDNGYRKQALRALTENNIPLDEIARLSKIDIGELELMRQLGRF